MITFAQLLVLIGQTNVALEAAENAESALEQVQAERSRMEEIKGRVQQLEQSIQETSHATTGVLLQIQTIEARVQELSAGRQKEIAELTRAVEDARKAYSELQAKLSGTAAVVEEMVTRTVTENRCKRFLTLICVPQLRVVTEPVKRPNPEYVELQQLAAQASKALEEAESRLSEALSK